MAATPGRFCEAMVTMNRGSARLTKACTLNSGAVNTGRAQSRLTAPAWNCPCDTTHTTDTSSVSGTA